MAFPSGWNRKCKITLDADAIDAALSNFTVVLTNASLPDEMLDSDGSYPALNGGGDIRFSSDAAGANQLACDIRTFTTATNTANAVADIAVNVASVAADVDTDIYIWYNCASQTQPAADSTYGQYAAYDSNTLARYPLNESGDGTADEFKNRKSNTLHGQGGGGTGSKVPTQVAGLADKCQSFDGGDKIVLSSIIPFSNATLSFWVKPTPTLKTYGDIGSGNGGWWLRHADSGQIQFYNGAALFSGGTGKLVQDTWTYVSVTYDGDKYRIYANGVLDTTSDGGQAALTDGSASVIGWRYDSYEWLGLIEECDFASTARAAAWLRAQYQNLSSPATFAVAGTPESSTQTYNVTLSETLTPSDSARAGNTMAASLSETVTASDAVHVVTVVSVSESVTPSDAFSASVTAAPVSMAGRGSFAQPVTTFRTMLSQSAAFQDLCRATNAAAALSYIYSFGDDSDLARPFAVVGLDNPRREAFSGGNRDYFQNLGDLTVILENPAVVSGSVTAQTADNKFTDSKLIGYASDHFRALRLTITSGARNGEYATVSNFDGATGELTLNSSLTGLPGVGATFEITGATTADTLTHFMNVLGDIVEDLEELSGTGGYSSFGQIAVESYGRGSREKEDDEYCAALLRCAYR